MERLFSDVSVKRDWDSEKFWDVVEDKIFSLVSVVFMVFWQEGAESPSSTGPCRKHTKTKLNTQINEL